MQFRISEKDIENLYDKVRNVGEYEKIQEILLKDSRILILFRLNCQLDRNEFSKRLKKSVNTIANLERGNKKIETAQKAKFYTSKLREFVELPLDANKIIQSYNKWKIDDLDGRRQRAIKNAKIGGFAASKSLSKKQRYLRARKGGVAAKLKHAGIHGKRHLWMEWFKKGLKTTGKRIYQGPNNEKMVNELELKVAIQLFKSDIKYQYEPLLRVEDRKFYPDFKTGDNIIECCYWESEDRWLYLAVKFSLYIMALVSTAFLLQNNYVENIFI